MGKEAIKKSDTLLANIGPSTTPITRFDLIVAPVRDTNGNVVAINVEQDTSTKCNVGNIVKYINVRIQTGPDDATPEDDTSGWLEWSIVKFKETSSSPPNTNIGTNTLGDICTKKYRGDSLLNGAIPVGGDQPSILDINLKVPDIMQKMQLQSKISLFVYFRSTNFASTSTTLNDVVLSCQYKLYV